MSAEPSRLLVAATVAFYMVAALVMIMANKWVLVTTTIPVFFIAVQISVSSLLLWIGRMTKLLKIKPLNWATAKTIWPLLLTNTLSILLGNFCLRYVDASFYQIARGLVLPFTVVLSYFLQSVPPSRWIVMSCVMVVTGFFLGVSAVTKNHATTAGGVSFIGIIFGLSSSITTAYHSFLIKSSLPLVDDSALEMANYSNAGTALMLFPISLIAGEGPEILKILTGQEPAGRLIVGILVTGFFGFFIGIAGLLSVKITSPITHMISSAGRGVLQTVLGKTLFHDVITSTRIGSIAIILVGSCHYIYVKHIEMSMPNKTPVEYSSRIIRNDRNNSSGYSSLQTDDAEALELRAMEEDIEGLLKETEGETPRESHERQKVENERQ